jgi:hypothetical protein
MTPQEIEDERRRSFALYQKLYSRTATGPAARRTSAAATRAASKPLSVACPRCEQAGRKIQIRGAAPGLLRAAMARILSDRRAAVCEGCRVSFVRVDGGEIVDRDGLIPAHLAEDIARWKLFRR